MQKGLACNGLLQKDSIQRVAFQNGMLQTVPIQKGSTQQGPIQKGSDRKPEVPNSETRDSEGPIQKGTAQKGSVQKYLIHGLTQKGPIQVAVQDDLIQKSSMQESQKVLPEKHENQKCPDLHTVPTSVGNHITGSNGKSPGHLSIILHDCRSRHYDV